MTVVIQIYSEKVTLQYICPAIHKILIMNILLLN